MSKPLDELRKLIQAHVDTASGDRLAAWRGALTYLNEFEAEHPGLVDMGTCSKDCPACVEFTTIFQMPAMEYMGCLRKQSDSSGLANKHAAPLDQPCPFCPVCAEEATHD